MIVLKWDCIVGTHPICIIRRRGISNYPKVNYATFYVNTNLRSCNQIDYTPPWEVTTYTTYVMFEFSWKACKKTSAY